MTARLAFLLALLFLPACVSVTAQSTPLGAIQTPLQPKPDANGVEVYTETPKRFHRELALIEARGPMGTSVIALLAEAKREAARIGADALIVSPPSTQQTSPGGAALVTMPGQAPMAIASGPQGVRILIAVAIVWHSQHK